MWRIFGRYLVFVTRGLTVGLFVGRPGPPAQTISGLFDCGGVGGSGPELNQFVFKQLPKGSFASRESEDDLLLR